MSDKESCIAEKKPSRAVLGMGSGGPAPAAKNTLIELLVVIASIAILAALLLPALSRAKIGAQGISCRTIDANCSFSPVAMGDQNLQKAMVFAGGGDISSL